MKILFLARNLGIGGGTSFRLRVGRALTARGHQVWVAGQPGVMAGRLAESSIRVCRVLPPPLDRLQLLHLARRHVFDIIHASNVGRGSAAVDLEKRTGIPYVLSIHGVLSPREKGCPCLRMATRLIAFDESVLHRLE